MKAVFNGIGNEVISHRNPQNTQKRDSAIHATNLSILLTASQVTNIKYNYFYKKFLLKHLESLPDLS